MRDRLCGWGVALVVSIGLVPVGSAEADQADVVHAKATCSADSVCTFVVTVRHADIGWKHYADRFEVLGPDGEILATRVLKHPHVHEQPFTRALRAAEIPEGIDVVVIRAHDSKHGDGGRQVRLPLERPGRTRSVKEPVAADAGKSK
jgi:hypothetical protein